MRMTVYTMVESDDERFRKTSVNSIGVDTRVPGIDPDSAKEDFVAQARALLSSIGETHVPALYAHVQKQVDGAGQEQEEPNEAERKITEKLSRIRARREASAEAPGKAEQDAQDHGKDATGELKEQV